MISKDLSNGQPDGMYVIRDLNIIINIHEIIGYLNSESIEFQKYKVLTSTLLELTEPNFLNFNAIREMTNDRRDQAIFITDLSGEVRIIDGHHRLQKRHFDNFQHCHIIDIPKDLIERFSSPYSDLHTTKRYSAWCREVFA
jgi:hypothetical protein